MNQILVWRRTKRWPCKFCGCWVQGGSCVNIYKCNERRSKENLITERNYEIYELRSSRTLTLNEIGERFDLGPGYIKQIVHAVALKLILGGSVDSKLREENRTTLRVGRSWY